MTKEKNIATENDFHDATSEAHIRLEKVEKLRAQGVEPWPAAKDVNATCKHVLFEFADTPTPSEKEYMVAGRVMIVRHHGKASFATIQDATGKLQLYFKQDDLGQEQYELFKHYVDMGDILWARGNSFRTKTGEITIHVRAFTLLSKSLHPLPDKFHGLHDVEVRYRQRYLDLISTPETRERFINRSLIVRTMRNFLDEHGFLEVETPMLHPIPGGAAARPFITHHNALDDDFYLRIAPELYLKRLVVGGLERVYEINRNFRNEGVSTRHNPEFTMLEMYWAHHDYHFIMGFVEEMFRNVAQKVVGKLQIPFGDHTLDFEKPFERLTIKQAVMKYGNYSEADLSEKSIDTRLKEHTITMANKNASWGEKIFALFEAVAEQKLIQPTFITEYPIEVSPLAKRDPKNPNVAARFELFMASMEISNGFNELNDPIDQAERFKSQVHARESGDTEAHHYDADYVLALEHALPPTVGVGIGIDRLVMLMTNTTSIKDVILFPTLKKKEIHSK